MTQGPGRTLRLASRGSALALTQSRAVAALLSTHLGSGTIEIEVVSTRGDQRQDVPLQQLGEGVFVKALEQELLDEHADLAVHSLKDVPSTETAGLVIGAVPEREDPRDALITRDGRPFDELPQGAVLATGSPRRIGQLRALRPDLQFTGVRGNVDTRLRKLDDGEFDGLVMAVAGLSRLGLSHRIASTFSLDDCTPAVGQGALGVQCRAIDAEVSKLLTAVDDTNARREITAERAFLAAIGGGCRVPVGAIARVEGTNLRLRAVVADLEGTLVTRADLRGSTDDAAELGQEAARALADTLARFQSELEP